MAAHPDPHGVAPPPRLSPKRSVAGYLRSATQLEGDALRRQLEAVIRYARDRGMQIVRVYCDECGSGLRRGGRCGLRQMFRDIESGTGDFDAILLFDPSRWGRFQEPDRAACLEHACITAGIEVHYCAEGLSDGDTRVTTVVRALERSMVRDHARKLTDPGRRFGLRAGKTVADGNGSSAGGSAERNEASDDASGAVDPRPASG